MDLTYLRSLLKINMDIKNLLLDKPSWLFHGLVQLIYEAAGYVWAVTWTRVRDVDATSVRTEGTWSRITELKEQRVEDRGPESTATYGRGWGEAHRRKNRRGEGTTKNVKEAKETGVLKKGVTMLSIFWQRDLIRWEQRQRTRWRNEGTDLVRDGRERREPRDGPRATVRTGKREGKKGNWRNLEGGAMDGDQEEEGLSSETGAKEVSHFFGSLSISLSTCDFGADDDHLLANNLGNMCTCSLRTKVQHNIQM